MNRPLFIIFATLLIFNISSCGPSAQEKARIEQEVQAKIEMRENLKTNLTNAQSGLETLNSNLVNAKASLDVANSDMDKLKEFHILRTNQEREAQVRAQSIKIQNLQAEISKIQEAITDQTTKIASIKANLEQNQ